jgi:hypothetical protein
MQTTMLILLGNGQFAEISICDDPGQGTLAMHIDPDRAGIDGEALDGNDAFGRAAPDGGLEAVGLVETAFRLR